MNNIEFPGYVLIQKPMDTQKPIADSINEKADLMDTLYVSNLLQSLFDLVLTKSEILSAAIGIEVWTAQISWRQFP